MLNAFHARLRRAAALGLVAGLAVLPRTSQAVGYLLADGNSTAFVDPGNGGLISWQVDGVQHLNQQWFWFRVGNSGGEAGIETISAPIVSQPDPTVLSIHFANANFRVELLYSLLGGSPGSGSSDLGEQIRVVNLTASPLDFHLFQYADFDLAGSGFGDTVQLGQNVSSLFNEATQTKGPTTMQEAFSGPGAQHGQADVYNVILTALTDGNPTTLNDHATFGPGDATFAFQWDLTIAPGGSVLIPKNLNLTTIPEPSSLSLLALGTLAFGIFRRSRRS